MGPPLNERDFRELMVAIMIIIMGSYSNCSNFGSYENFTEAADRGIREPARFELGSGMLERFRFLGRVR